MNTVRISSLFKIAIRRFVSKCNPAVSFSSLIHLGSSNSNKNPANLDALLLPRMILLVKLQPAGVARFKSFFFPKTRMERKKEGKEKTVAAPDRLEYKYFLFTATFDTFCVSITLKCYSLKRGI